VLTSDADADRDVPTQGPFRAAEPEYLAELEQLARLRDEGIRTPEEFEAKKKQIHGL